MIKTVLVYSVAFATLFFSIYYAQDFILNKTNQEVRFNLWDTNLFFAVASLVICMHFSFFSGIKKLQSQLGFIYLPTLFIKGVIFFLAFKSSVFSMETLTVAERLNLLIPFLLFLGLETYFITKILKEKKP